MPRETFDSIYERACVRKGGEKNLKKLVSKPKSSKKLKSLTDDRYLSEFTKKIFQSGFVWRVVEKKWPEFENMFLGFGINDVLMISDERFEKIAKDPAIIRNYRKVMTVKENAMMIHDIQCQGQRFSEFVADWPSTDIVGLWDYLKKHGSRLGGNTGPYALRTLGKDTFLMSRDVEQYLRKHKVFDGGVASKRSRAEIQEFFNELKSESGKSLQELSQILSYSFGDNFVGIES